MRSLKGQSHLIAQFLVLFFPDASNPQWPLNHGMQISCLYFNPEGKISNMNQTEVFSRHLLPEMGRVLESEGRGAGFEIERRVWPFHQ